MYPANLYFDLLKSKADNVLHVSCRKQNITICLVFPQMTLYMGLNGSLNINFKKAK